jgi:histone acetyltransferase
LALECCAQWVGYIKDYDGGTLMECVIHPRLPHTAFPAMIAAQRAALDRHIRTLSNAHVVHPGLPAFQQAAAQPQQQQQAGPQQAQAQAQSPAVVDIASIPGAHAHACMRPKHAVLRGWWGHQALA